MKYKFKIADGIFTIYESEQVFETREAAEEKAKQWCDEFKQGMMEADPGANIMPSFGYYVIEVKE